MASILAWIAPTVTEDHVRRLRLVYSDAEVQLRSGAMLFMGSGRTFRRQPVSEAATYSARTPTGKYSAGSITRWGHDGSVERALHVSVANDGLVVDVNSLGLRSIYTSTAELDGTRGTLVSTRLDWITRIVGECEIDVETLGGHWLGFNQFACRSLVSNVERVSGGRLTVDVDGFRIDRQRWQPRSDEGSFLESLDGALAPLRDDPDRWSLGLSGGLDSRLLLSMLKSRKHETNVVLNCHVFGNPIDPDVSVSTRIGAADYVAHKALEEPDLDASAALSLLREYCATTCATTPATAGIKYLLYGSIAEQGRVIVDGAFGEVGRRQYLNRLRLFGRAALRNEDAEKLVPHFRYARSPVFCSEVMQRMKQGMVDELRELIHVLRATFGDDANLLIDGISIASRLPNYYGYGQAWVDMLADNFMPFTEVSVLSSIMQVSRTKESSTVSYKRVIRERAPGLAKLPLVKGGREYPFWLGGVAATGYAMMRRRVGSQAEKKPNHYLELLKEYVIDSSRDRSTRDYALYDPVAIQDLVDRYYAGEGSLEAAVDWWLAFDLWRRSLQSSG